MNGYEKACLFSYDIEYILYDLPKYDEYFDVSVE